MTSTTLWCVILVTHVLFVAHIVSRFICNALLRSGGVFVGIKGACLPVELPF